MGCASSNYQKQNVQVTPLAKKKKQDVIPTQAPVIPRNAVEPVKKPFNPDAGKLAHFLFHPIL